jgi:hypothetical protein
VLPESVPPRKAGNQGNFRGPHKAFLETFVESYFTAVKTKKMPQFWGPTYSSFHQKFDWHILLTDSYPEDHTFSLEVDDADLDEASVTLKKERVEDVNKVCLLCLLCMQLTDNSHRRFTHFSVTSNTKNTMLPMTIYSLPG